MAAAALPRARARDDAVQPRAVAACALSTALLLLAGPFPAAQALAQVDLTLGFNLYLIVVTKYSVLYSPPDLFGTMSGVLFTVVSVLMGISAAIVGLVVNAASSSSSPLLQYQGPFLALGVGAIADARSPNAAVAFLALCGAASTCASAAVLWAIATRERPKPLLNGSRLRVATEVSF